MYILIQHSGSAYHNKVANYIKDYAEDNYGAVCEFEIGEEDSPIILYNDDHDKIAEFSTMPDEEVLDMHLKLNYLED